MSKSKDLAKKFELPSKPKGNIIKTDTPDDHAINNGHHAKAKEKEKKKSINENSVRVTLDLSEELHSKIRVHVAQNRQTIKDFMITAIKLYLEK